MKAKISIFVSGLILALGLAVSGLTNADRVIGFLNVAGDWDPSLAFVMGGAIAVHLLFFRLIMRRESPLFATHFGIPTRKDIDKRLVVGSALFGIGWGLGGFCPGPGIVSTMSFGREAVVFIGTMAAGMWGFHKVEDLVGRRRKDDDRREERDAAPLTQIAA